MRKIIFLLFVVLAFAVNGFSQDLYFYSATNIKAGSEYSGVFRVSTEFDNIVKSISGISDVNYNISNETDRKLLEVSFIKDNIYRIIGFEIGEISAMVGAGNTETHTCTGRCSDDISSAATFCSCCKFQKKNGKIIGCECCQTGCCVHTVSVSVSGIKTTNDFKQSIIEILN